MLCTGMQSSACFESNDVVFCHSMLSLEPNTSLHSLRWFGVFVRWVLSGQQAKFEQQFLVLHRVAQPLVCHLCLHSNWSQVPGTLKPKPTPKNCALPPASQKSFFRSVASFCSGCPRHPPGGGRDKGGEGRVRSETTHDEI